MAHRMLEVPAPAQRVQPHRMRQQLTPPRRSAAVENLTAVVLVADMPAVAEAAKSANR
jgi:hypothetical protein